MQIKLRDSIYKPSGVWFLLIFLIANFGIILPKIFLGDSGSMSLGFLVASLLIYYTHPDYRNFHPILTIWCVAIPTYDLLTVFAAH